MDRNMMYILFITHYLRRCDIVNKQRVEEIKYILKNTLKMEDMLSSS